MSTFGRDTDEEWSRENIRLDAEVIAFDTKQKRRRRLLIDSDDFIAGFTPPNYFLEGVALKRYLYSVTGMTGSGKTALLLLLAAHAALGKPLAGREIDPGRVVYLAGENPDDVRMRWIAMGESMGLERVPVRFVEGR